jgi:hypothetical protein
MKKSLTAFLLISLLLPIIAEAQKLNKPECYKRCTAGHFDDVYAPQHDEKMKKIRANKDGAEKAGDAEKIKSLGKEEADENERYDDKVSRTCKKVCQVDE